MFKYFSEAIPPSLQNYLGPPDERVKNWFLLNSPLCMIVIYSLYMLVISGGTHYMKNRKPFQLKSVLIIYNTFQVLYSVYVCKEVFISAYLGDYHLMCANLDTSRSANSMRMARAMWLFYLSKVIDLADTLFFVLRKKKSQLSFLHCYHHATMICNWYVGVLYLPGGQAFVSVLLNTFVHACMYSYYLLAALGPSFRKYLWWKKYLTQMQLVQFVLVIIHIVVGLVNNCKAPKWLAYFTITYLCTLVALFINFYIKSYKKRSAIRSQKLKEFPTKYSGSKFDLKAAGDWKKDKKQV